MNKTSCQKKFFRDAFFISIVLLLGCQLQPLPALSIDQLPSSANSLPIDEVWAGTRIAYDAISVGPIVYVAYYDAERRFSVARVDTATHAVTKKTLDSVFAGWDAHNSIVLAYDRTGYLHVTGNMHAIPLIYARTLRPNDFNSLTQTNRMVGNDESSVTYPNFFFLANGDLLFSYRSGKSGNGVELINRFDDEHWLRLLSQPLFAPTTTADPVNAYHTPYTLGPDGYYHIAWVWRKTPMAETNFNVGYARSKDLVHWEDSRQRAINLPITPANAEVVDIIPINGGLLNNIKLSFDNSDRPIISYMKYDSQGNSQLYHARLRGVDWQIVQATDWKYRWAFSGGGTLVSEISFSGVRNEGKHLLDNVTHKLYGKMQFELDPVTLLARKIPAPTQSMPNSDKIAASSLPYITSRVNIRPTSKNSVRGQIQWQTLPADNNDKPRSCESVGHPSGCKMTSHLEIVHLDAH